MNNKIKTLIKFGIPNNIIRNLPESRINSLYRKVINEVQQHNFT